MDFLRAVAHKAEDPWAAGRVLVLAVNIAYRVLRDKELAQEVAVEAAYFLAKAASTKPPETAARAVEQLLSLQTRFIRPKREELRLSLRMAEAIFDAAAKETGDYLKAGDRMGRLADIAGSLRDQAERNRLERKAAEYYELAFKNEKDIERKLRAKEGKIRRVYGRWLKETERARQALAEIEMALRAVPSGYKGRPLLNLHNMAGDIARERLKDYPRALAHYGAVLKLAPKGARERWAAYKGIALCYIEVGNKGGALKAVKGLSAEIDPKDNWAGRLLLEIADFAMKQGLKEVAVEAYGAIVKGFWGRGGEGVRIKRTALRRYHRLVNPNEPPPGFLPPPDYFPKPPSPEAVPAPIVVSLERVATYQAMGQSITSGAQAILTDSLKVSILAGDRSAEGMLLMLDVWSPRGFTSTPKGARKDPEGDVARLKAELPAGSPMEAEFVLSRVGARFPLQGWSITRAFQPLPTGRCRVTLTIKAPVPVRVEIIETKGCVVHEDTLNMVATRGKGKVVVLGPGGGPIDCRAGLLLSFEVSPPEGVRAFAPRVEVTAVQEVKVPSTAGGTNWIGVRAWPDLAISVRSPGWFRVEEATAKGVLKVVLPEAIVK